VAGRQTDARCAGSQNSQHGQTDFFQWHGISS
jgi:hypothetical protein